MLINTLLLNYALRLLTNEKSQQNKPEIKSFEIKEFIINNWNMLLFH